MAGRDMAKCCATHAPHASTSCHARKRTSQDEASTRARSALQQAEEVLDLQAPVLRQVRAMDAVGDTVNPKERAQRSGA